MKLRQPSRLQKAIRMVKILQERYLNENKIGRKARKGCWKEEKEGEPNKSPSPGRGVKEKEVEELLRKGKKLTREEVQQRDKKWLCFKCGEKWGIRHKCGKGHVFLNLASDDDEWGEEECGESDEVLMLNALCEAKKPPTMRLLALIGKNKVSL